MMNIEMFDWKAKDAKEAFCASKPHHHQVESGDDSVVIVWSDSPLTIEEATEFYLEMSDIANLINEDGNEGM